MKYALMIYEAESDFAKRNSAAAGEYWGAWMAYSQSVQEAGGFSGGAGLEPPTSATWLSHSSGQIQVQDGP